MKGTSGSLPIQPHCSSSITCSQLPRTVSRPLLNSYKGKDLLGSSDNLSHCLVTLTGNTVCPDTLMEPPVSQLTPITSCLVLRNRQTEPGSVFLTQCLQILINIDQTASFFTLQAFSSPSHIAAALQPFLIQKMLQTLNHFSGPNRLLSSAPRLSCTEEP